jgi:hypothetical protein
MNKPVFYVLCERHSCSLPVFVCTVAYHFGGVTESVFWYITFRQARYKQSLNGNATLSQPFSSTRLRYISIFHIELVHIHINTAACKLKNSKETTTRPAFFSHLLCSLRSLTLQSSATHNAVLCRFLETF